MLHNTRNERPGGLLYVSAPAPRFDARRIATTAIRGALAVMAIIVLLLVAARPAQAQGETALYNFTSPTETVLYNFTGPDGWGPDASLISDAAGNFYGTTWTGGLQGWCPGWPDGCGVIFEISPNGSGGWAETVLYSFGLPPDAANATAPLIFDKAGNLYGTTANGGTYDWGAVFKLSPSGATWTETVLYSFTGGADGGQPFSMSGLFMDPAGNLYGTTGYGGVCAGACGGGTVFKLTPTGTETVLYSFGSQSGDGTFPWGGLVFRNGYFYGATVKGGAYGQGTVFKLAPTGNETVLYSFGSRSGDGSNPYNLVMDKNGNLYGTTLNGAAYGGGTVFKLTPTGVETILHTFGSQPGDGLNTGARLVFDQKGDLWGTTQSGGVYNEGTVFVLIPTRGEKVVYSFGSQPGDGSVPAAALLFDKAGNLYGTTTQGGANGMGTVFKLTR